MSHNEQPTSGIEFVSTLEARRNSIAAIGVMVALGALFFLATQFSFFPEGQVYLTIVQIPLLVLIFLFRKRDLGAWFGIATLVVAALGSTFTVPMSDARVSASTVLFIAMYCGIIMLNNAWQLVWIVCVALLWTQTTPSVVLPFDIRGVDINLRWATWVQLIVAGVLTSYVWNKEFRQLTLRDSVAIRSLERRAEALALRERLRVWRESLVRVHETVLNDIRSVVEAAQIDGVRLLQQLRTSSTFAPPQHAKVSLPEIIQPLNIMQTEQRLLIGKLPDIRLDNEQARALRSALLEIMRNAYRHAGAVTLRLEAIADAASLRVSIFSDGASVRIPDSDVGIGTGVVLQDAIDRLGATLDSASGTVTLRMPLEVASQRIESPVDVDAGRAVVSAIGTGNAVGGVTFYLAITVNYGWRGWLMALAGILIAATSATVMLRRTNASPLLLVTAAPLALAVPLMARNFATDCAMVELPLIVTALTSLGFFSLLVWVPNRRWWTAGVPFIAVLFVLNDEAMASCTAGVAPTMLSAFAAPILMGLTLVTTWLSVRRNAQLERMQLVELRDSAAATAAEELGTALHSAIERAQDLLNEVATTGDLTDPQRLRLRCVDSEIRATIQVDPETAGALSLAARNAIHEAAANEAPVRVLVLRDSGDRRALPPSVTAVLTALLRAATDGSASIQILSNADEDVLTVTLSEAARQASDMPPTWSVDFDSGRATLDAGDDAEPALFIVQRTRPAPDSSVHQDLALQQ